MDGGVLVAAVLLLGSAACAKSIWRRGIFGRDTTGRHGILLYAAGRYEHEREMLESAQQESEILLLTGVYEETRRREPAILAESEAEDIRRDSTETEPPRNGSRALIEEQKAGQYTFGEIAEDTLGA